MKTHDQGPNKKMKLEKILSDFSKYYDNHKINLFMEDIESEFSFEIIEGIQNYLISKNNDRSLNFEYTDEHLQFCINTIKDIQKGFDASGHLKNHCWNKKCFNFSSNHDLSGLWCCDECILESECNYLERITRKELLEMKLKYSWTLDKFEKAEVEKMPKWIKDNWKLKKWD